jgi:hypothetical protein
MCWTKTKLIIREARKFTPPMGKGKWARVLNW